MELSAERIAPLETVWVPIIPAIILVGDVLMDVNHIGTE